MIWPRRRPAQGGEGEVAHAEAESLVRAMFANGRLPQSIALIWLLYILMLLAVDILTVRIRHSGQIFPLSYYIGHSLTPLGFLCLSLLQPIKQRLGPALLKLLILAIATMPQLVTPLALREPTVGPLTSSATFIAMRMMPVQYIGLILVCLQYRWPQLFAYALGSGAFGITLNLFTWTQMPFGITILQAFAALVNGACITLLADRLRIKSQELEQANQQLRHHASTLEHLTVSRERNRMARELHDTLAHTLADLTVQMETAKAYARRNPDTTCAILDTALTSARNGLGETRRSLKALRANPLDELGLTLALADLARTTAEAAGLQLELSIDDTMPDHAPEIDQAVYRIAQEALANIKHHAGASALSISLGIEHGRLLLTIQDDGRGFDTLTQVSPGHYGLTGMKERAQLTGGTLTITSEPGRGTTVHFEIGV